MLLLALAAYSRLFLIWVEIFIVLLVLIVIVLLKVFEITLSWVAALVWVIVILVIVLVLILVLVFVLILLIPLLFPEFVNILYVRQLLRQTWWLLRVIQIRIFKNLLDCNSLLWIIGKHFFKQRDGLRVSDPSILQVLFQLI